MRQEVLYEMKALYRDDFRVQGYRFGSGKKAACIMGSMRGNEFQQIYVCSKLIQKLEQLEEQGDIADRMEILVIPCANPYSVNVKKRFWTIDNTDINRMYPGYSLGETTQRIAGGIFEQIKDYSYGIQFASFYMPGDFVPQVRVMKTGRENVELAAQFALPYVVLHTPRPFDTATLNYNWQIWDTEAFSIYTTSTSAVDRESAQMAVDAVLNFLGSQDVIAYCGHAGCESRVVETKDFVDVRTRCAGFFERNALAGEHVKRGELLATVTEPYTGALRQKILAPVDGTVAFVHNEIMAYQDTAVYKLICDKA